jgi:hypothetical protein
MKLPFLFSLAILTGTLLVGYTEANAWLGLNLNVNEPQPVVVAQPQPVYVVPAQPQPVMVVPQGQAYYYPENAAEVIIGRPGWFHGRYFDGRHFDKRYDRREHWDGHRWAR